MDISRFEKISDTEWRIAPFGAMRAPGIIYANESLLTEMDDKVFEQVTNVAMLPGIMRASYAMPDAHWGYGFPIGGVAAFDPKAGGVVSAGGVGFDVSCGVRATRLFRCSRNWPMRSLRMCQSALARKATLGSIRRK
jgi:tRNA-splicing ligase RtcB